MLCKLGISSSSADVPSILVYGNAQGDGTISTSSLSFLVLRFCLFLVLRFRFFDVIISLLVTVDCVSTDGLLYFASSGDKRISVLKPYDFIGRWVRMVPV